MASKQNEGENERAEFKSPGPDELYPRILKKHADVILEHLSIIFENSWRIGEVPEE